MPRPLRIETNEGVYHVTNRGNYRSHVFADDGAKDSFEKCLVEASERFGWRFRAYCVMGNHFHLCLATPRGNLSEALERRMCRGWRIGDKSFKQAHAKELLAKKDTLRLEKEGLADLNEAHWEGAFEKCLATLRQSEAAAKATAKSAPWKLAVAAKLKSQTSVGNKWLSERLRMGTPRGVRSDPVGVREAQGSLPALPKPGSFDFRRLTPFATPVKDYPRPFAEARTSVTRR